MNKKTKDVLDKKNEAGIVLIAPTETQSSVKIEQIAGGTRVHIKAYSNNLSEAAKEAQIWYDKLRKKYKENE